MCACAGLMPVWRAYCCTLQPTNPILLLSCTAGARPAVGVHSKRCMHSERPPACALVSVSCPHLEFAGARPAVGVHSHGGQRRRRCWQDSRRRRALWPLGRRRSWHSRLSGRSGLSGAQPGGSGHAAQAGGGSGGAEQQAAGAAAFVAEMPGIF